MWFSRNKALIIVCVSFLLLGLYAAYNSPFEDDTKTFGLENFYVGEEHEEIDPRMQYGVYTAGNLDDITCLPSMSKGVSMYTCKSNVVWMVDNSVKSDEEVASVITGSVIDATECIYQPFKDGDMILAPAAMTFTNSNVEQTSLDRIDITGKLGTDYEIVFTNVKSWWCHIGKSNPKQHSTVYGNKGTYSNCAAGCVIGQANSSTQVQLKKKNPDTGVFEPYPFEQFYAYGF